MSNPAKRGPKTVLSETLTCTAKDPTFVQKSQDDDPIREIFQGAVADAIAMNPRTEELHAAAKSRYRTTVAH